MRRSYNVLPWANECEPLPGRIDGHPDIELSGRFYQTVVCRIWKVSGMRIGIDFHSAEREGSGNCTYIRNLVEALLAIDQKNEYFLYVIDGSYPYYERFEKISNAVLCLTKPHNPFLRIPLLGMRTFIDGIDLLHVQYIAPPFHKGKSVVTIHDISFLHLPECFKPFECYRLKILLPMNIRNADKIVTGSHHSKQDIVGHYNIGTENIEVINHGASRIFRRMEYSEEDKTSLNQYGISDRFILFVGRRNSRKNIASLIRSFLILKERNKIPHKLVIVGIEDFSPEVIPEDVETVSCRQDIVFTGYLPEHQLIMAYNLAELFVYPSLYEGFGLPCLEAMSCGCPVVTGDISSLPEVVGNAGLLTDTQNEEELANTIYRVIADSQLREGLRERGLKQASMFTWESVARKTLAVYQGVAC